MVQGICARIKLDNSNPLLSVVREGIVNLLCEVSAVGNRGVDVMVVHCNLV